MIEIYYKGKHLMNIFGKDIQIVFIGEDEDFEVKE